MKENEGNMKDKKSGLQILLTLAVLLILAGCSANRKKPSSTENPNESVTYEKGADFTCVVKSVDKANMRVVLYNTLVDDNEEYQYFGGTEIYSKGGRNMVMDEIEPGDVFDVYLGEKSEKISRMEESADIIEKLDSRVFVNADEHRLTIDDVNYAYNEHLVALSDGREIDPMEITSSDEITFRGVKGHAYSLIVTKGHGYIQPTNYKDFLGGVLTLYGEAILPVSEDMLIVVQEGSQQLTMDNGDLTGTTTVEVKRNQVTKVNMAQYQNQVPDTARVTFQIEPEGAELYINGKLTDYSKKVSLKYGNHSVRVTLEGYNDYTGIITIRDSGPVFRISLPQETAESDSSTSSVGNSGSSSGTTASTPKTDASHTITVSAPEGAAVYVDGTYKGEVPCSFSKLLGNVTLTLTKKGSQTKSYNIEISDDNLNVNWSFPDLEEKSTGSVG